MSQEEQILQLQNEVAELKRLFYKNKFSNLQVFDTPVQFQKTISTDADSKLGFFGVTPIVRKDHVANPSGGATEDSEARSAINSILSTLELFGFHKTS